MKHSYYPGEIESIVFEDGTSVIDFADKHVPAGKNLIRRLVQLRKENEILREANSRLRGCRLCRPL